MTVKLDASIASLPDYWLDTGRPDQYLQANLDLIRGRRGSGANGTHHTARVDATATVSDSVIGLGAVVGPAARITESVLLPGAVVAAGAIVDRSVIAGQVGRNAVVVQGIIGSDYVVGAGVEVIDRRLPSPD